MANGVPALHPERRGQLNWSPKQNWIEKRGGLPPYINSISTALVRGGMSRDRAIAIAVSSVRKTCATGMWGGNPKMPISPAIRSAACAAAAKFAAMAATTSVSEARLVIDLAERWTPERSIELAWDEIRAERIIELSEPPSFVERVVERIRRALTEPKRAWS